MGTNRTERVAYVLFLLERAAEALNDLGHPDVADTAYEEASAIRRRYGLDGVSQNDLVELAQGEEVEPAWRFAIASRGRDGTVVVWDWYERREDAEADPRVQQGVAEVIGREELPEEYAVEFRN
jgi:hypothetical protein